MKFMEFLKVFNEESIQKFKISLILMNLNLNIEEDLYSFSKLGITEIKFINFIFRKDKINNIFENEKYGYLDKRNFSIIRSRKSPKNQLLKYTGFFNQLGDILFCGEKPFYPAKINIAIGGFIGSGKSTFINTIFGEKRCLEGQGSSITNYISHYSLKDYPLNFIDFQGFRAKIKGKDNTSLFIDDIKNKISDLKKANEIIHCFLFCIKYEERIFDEEDEDMKKVFDVIFGLQIRTFFIVTNSEKENTREFERFKTNIINHLDFVKRNYSDGEIKKVLGDDLNNDIIPILSMQKKFHGYIAKSYGLDTVFKKLYDYFSKKKIDTEFDFSDDNKVKELIDNNELLKVFESKKHLMEDLKNKIKIQCESFLFKTFLTGPKYLYNISEESLNNFLSGALNHLFIAFKYYIEQQSDIDKLHIFHFFNFTPEFIKDMKESFIKEVNLKEGVEEIKEKIPTYAKVLFPVLSIFYYIIGIPAIKIFSGKIIDYFMKEIKINELMYEIYFQKLVEAFNKAIEDLNILRKTFDIAYSIPDRVISFQLKE